MTTSAQYSQRYSQLRKEILDEDSDLNHKIREGERASKILTERIHKRLKEEGYNSPAAVFFAENAKRGLEKKTERIRKRLEYRGE